MSKVAWTPLCAAGMALAVALGGCTTPGAMSGTAMDFNETVARTSDSQILLNVVRAAHRNPTHYSAITQVRDSRSVSGNAQIAGAFQFGPHNDLLPNTLSPTLAATGSLTPSFDVAPLDNREAATGLFHPVDPQIPLTYWQQNWPPMVLLFMFVDDVTINDAAKKACGLGDVPGHLIDNAAFDEKHFMKVRKLFECLAPKLFAVPNTTKTTFIKQANIPPEKVLESLVDLDKADFDVTEKNLDGRKVYTISKEKKQWKFVLLFGGGPRVMSSDKSTVMNDRRPSVSFDFRSVDGMVYYLGELLRLQRRIGRPLTVPGYQGREDILFNVEVNALADPAHNITADFLGDRYSISRHPVEGDRTLTVLSLLSQVFSLYRQEKDLPKTSAVTVVGAR